MADHRNIIHMAPFMTDTRHPSIREVEGYWDAIRSGQLVPRRSDVDPRGIERSLEFAFILERIAPGIARLRIAGSHLTDLMGMEVRGMPLSTFFAPADRAGAGDLLEQVFATPAKVELALVSEAGVGKPQIDARMILLPMKSDLGDISRALGCLSTRGEIGRAPRRFMLGDSKVSPLLRPALPEDAPATTDMGDPAPLEGMAEPPRSFTPRQDPRPYLRLVHTTDD